MERCRRGLGVYFEVSVEDVWVSVKRLCGNSGEGVACVSVTDSTCRASTG